MSTSGSALLRACLLASVPIAALAQSPVIVEAESGTLGTSLTIVPASGTTPSYITTTENNGANPTPQRTATYQVNFPAPGSYALYVRVLVGPNTGNDDSFYVPTGFNTTTSWAAPYNQSSGGANNPTSTVTLESGAGQNVWKWIRLTPTVGIIGGFGPAEWVVPAGSLSQTFAWGSREDGLLFDKFAFAPVQFCYTVANLDAGSAPTGTCPPPDPPPSTRTDPPLATGKDKYLGSAWSPGTASLSFANYWNQVTPENGGKWGTVEATRDTMVWDQADASYALAKNNGFPFKWHTLVWGNQQPGWIAGLTPAEQLEEIREWYAAIAERFPAIDQIDVVNEPLHAPPAYIAGLGGSNDKYGTGWDWVITSFELARQYFPNAKLLINDYSITNDRNATNRYLTIINLLKERGLIDAIGDQGHAFSTTEAAPMPNHKANLDLLAATGLPIYISELDIDGVSNDVIDNDLQVANFKRIFPTFWEHPGVKGITMWGYVRGFHWRNGQGDWLLYPNGAERPALQWLEKYVADTPPSVNPGQAFSTPENANDTPEVAAAIHELEIRGYTLNSDTVTTMMLMIRHPEGFTANNPVTNQPEFWAGGANNYNDSNLQFIVWRAHFGAASVGIPVGTVVAVDADSGQTLSDWRIETPGGFFSIDANTGTLAMMPYPPLDFESLPTFTFQVSVSDGYQRSKPEWVTVNLTNVNDNVPVITAGQAYRIDGGRKNTVARVLATDDDDVNQPGFTKFSAWTITSGNTNNVFRFNGTGDLQVGRPLLIDWRRTSYSLGTTVSDSVHTSEVQPVQVTIPNRVNLCLLNAIRLEAPKATAPLLILLGADLGSCR
jgi:endo-1,4-beta-xylanase